MPIRIEAPRIERLAHALALRKGSTVDEVVTQALEEAWDQARQREERRQSLIADLLAIVERYKQLPTLDTRSDDEILGYGEDGLPH